MSTEPTEAPADDLISVPVPRAVAWIVSKIGWPGLAIALLLAQATGWIDVAFLALGLPPLLGDHSTETTEATEDTEDTPSECAELLHQQQAETIYRRAMTSETLAILARIEARLPER